jgi:hypothetical protein
MSWRAVARQAGGQNHSNVTRLGRGESPNLSNVAGLLMWLGATDLAPYLNTDDDSTE